MTEVRRIGPEDGFLREFTEFRDRVKSLETKPSGNIVIRETLTTEDPLTGVKTTIGQLPDGSYGFQPFIGDIIPPPVATVPVVTAQPGSITVSWNGLFVNNEVMPRDFEHVNVIGHKIVTGSTVFSQEVGVIRLASETVIVSTDVAAIGESWQFSLASEDFNGNTAVRGVRSSVVTMLSNATDAEVDAALQNLTTSVQTAQTAANTAQTAAGTAQTAANNANQAALDAAGIANTKGKVITQSATPSVADQSANNLWIDTTSGLNTPKRWNGSVWLAVTDKVATDAAGAAATAQTKADQAFNNAATAATAAGTAQTTADGKNRVWYQTTAPAGTGNKVGDTWFDTDDGYKIYVWNGSAWTNSQDTAIPAAQATANAKTKTYYQTTSPGTVGNTSGDIWFDTSNGNKPYVWNGASWASAQDVSIATAQTAANTAQTSANGKNTVYYQTTAPTGGVYKVGDTWFDTTNGNKIWVWNGSVWADSQDTAILKTMVGTLSSDIDTTATNKWLFTRYNKTTSAGTSPSYLDIINVPGTSSIVSDGASLVNTVGDNYIGVLRTVVYTASSTTVSITASHDDGGRIYLDGTSVYTKGTVGTGAVISFAVPAGWHVLDLLWAEQAGGDGWYNISPAIGSFFSQMYAPVSMSATASTATTANSTANSALTTANSKTKTYFQSTSPGTSGNVTGDIWFDTGNGNKTYVWNGSAWTLAQDTAIAAAQTSANGKNRIYYQTTQPSGGTYIAGDTWFDTANGNRISVYSGSAWVLSQDASIATAQTAANTAQTTANAKTTTFTQATAPSTSGRTAGDIWFDTSNGNKPMVWSGAAWVSAQDTSISSAQSTANTALTSANGKNRNYYQTTVPTGGTYITGDTWFDTDDNYKLYTYSGSAWIVTQDSAGAITTAASDATTKANAAQAAAISAAATDATTKVATKTKTYFQTAQPSNTGNTTGDTWFDTDDGNKVYVWNGTAWTVAQDAAIAAAQTSANGKNKTYYQTAQPAGGVLGDTWFDTDDGYKIYVHNGTTWVASQDAAIATAQTAANTAQTAANTANTAAGTAQTTANSKTKTFIQSTAPTATTVGDIWIDTANGNVIKIWDGTTWVNRADAAIATAQTQANTALTSANGKNRVYYQTAMPTGGTYILGDTWFDTDDGNKIYVHNGTTFVASQDTSIATAQSTANTANTAAGTAQTTANSALTTANSKTKTYFQSTSPGTSGNVTGDIWFDTGNGNKTYVWNGSAWTLAQDTAIAAAQTSANGKNRIYYQTAQPSGGTYIAGDTWFDTDDGNKIYVYSGSSWVNAQDATIATAQTAANAAQTTANSKTKTFIQSTAPTATTTGDIWIDTANGNVIKTWEGSAWVLRSDAAIATAQTAANTAQTTANGKNKAYYQTAQPSGGTYIAGDLWFDTDDSYKLYTYSGSAWVLAQDAATAQTTANTALSTANAKTKTYFQTTSPGTSGNTVGDTWFDTGNGNKVYVWNGSAWTLAQDTAIAAAQTSANGKNRIYYQTAQPSGGTYIAGDTWFDTDDGYKIYVYNGTTFTASQLGSSAIADLSITNAKIADATIQSAKIANLDAGKITTGTLDANRIGADTITATHIATDAISANELAANSITAAKGQISDLAITTAKIADAQITNAKIVDATIQSAKIGSVDAGTITVGTLSANRIGANTITADKLLVGDFQNLATINEVNGITVASYGQTQIVGGYNSLVTDSGSFLMFKNQAGPVPFKNGDRLYYKFTAKATAATTAALGVWIYNAAGSNRTVTTSSFNIGTTATVISGSIQVPDYDATFGPSVTWVVGLQSVTNKGIQVKEVIVRRMNGGELLVDGTITAGSAIIATGAIGTAQIGNLAVTDAQIAIATIQSAKIANLDAGKITTGTLDANRIGADTITATHIATDAISANELAANSITAAKGQISDLAITTAKIQDVAITTAKIANLAVTDAQIAIATIQSAKIANLDAGKITTGTLDANRIGANTISATKLLVADPEELIPNPFFHPSGEPVVMGTTLSSASTEASAGAPYPYLLKIQTRDNFPFATANIAVRPGDQFYIEAWVRAAPTTTRTFSFYIFGSDIPVGGLSAKFNSVQTVTTTWTKKTYSFTVPSNATYTYIKPCLQVETVGGDTADKWMWYVTGWSMRRKNTGELIVDGAIQAGSAIIATGAIGTAQIGNLAVTDAQIAIATIQSAKIANLDAGKITTGTLDANRIGADTITATHIATDAISANELAANSITVGKGQITDLAVTTAKINDLAITDAKIATATITAAKIGSVDAGTITVGTLSAARIGANTITADKLVIGSTDNLINEPTFANSAASWGLTTGMSIDVTGARNGGPALKIVNTTGQQATYNLPYETPTEANAAFFGSFWIKSDVAIPAAGVTLGIRYKLSDNTYSFGVFANSGSISSNTWTRLSGRVTAPALAISLSVYVASQTNFTTGTLWVDYVAVTRASTGELIVDGAIQAGSAIIATGAIGTAQIGNLAVTDAQIAIATIQSAKIANLDAGKITTGTLDANRIGADTITATHIATDAISANELAANSITVGKGQITDLAVTTAKINDLAITDAKIATATITAAKIGSVDAGTITVGTLSAARIGAGTITADKVLLADINNYWENPDFESDTIGAQPRGIVSNANVSVVDISALGGTVDVMGTAGNGTGKAMAINALTGSNNDVYGLNLIPVNPGDQFYMEYEGRHLNTAGTGNAQAGFRTYGPTKNALSWAGVAVYGTTKSTVWAKKTGTYTVPTGVSYLQVWMTFNANGETTNRFWVDNFILRKKATAELVVDGLIQAGSAIIGTGAIGTAQITDLAVTTAKINDLAITDAKIATATITAAKIGSVDAGTITVGTLSAARIAAKSLTVDKLVITSTDNLAVEADFGNNGSSWQLGANNTINATAGRGSLPSMRFTGTTSAITSTNLVNKVSVGAEDRFRVGMWVNPSTALATGTVALMAKCYTTASTSTNITLASNSTALTATQWNNLTGISPVLPAGTVAIEFYLSVTNDATGTITDIDYVGVTRAADGNLIVDGAIDGKTITGATIRTASTGPRIVLDQTSLNAWNSAGSNYFSMSDAVGVNISSVGTAGYDVTRINRCYNPTFGTNITSWTSSQTISRDTAQTFVGTASMKVTHTATADRSATSWQSLWANGTTYVLSGYVRHDAVGAKNMRADIQWLDNTLAVITTFTGTAVSVPTGTWTRVSVVTTGIPPGNTNSIRMTFTGVGMTSTENMWVDAVLLESGTATVGTYFDGETPPTANISYAWEGTAGLSYSDQRTARNVTIKTGGNAILNPGAGTSQQSPGVGFILPTPYTQTAGLFSDGATVSLIEGASDPQLTRIDVGNRQINTYSYNDTSLISRNNLFFATQLGGITLASGAGGIALNAGSSTVGVTGDLTVSGTTTIKHRRAEFNNGGFGVYANQVWDIGTQTIGASPGTLNNDFCQAGPYSGSIGITKSGYYAFMAFAQPLSNPGGTWLRAMRGSDSRNLGQTSNGAAWENTLTTLPFYFAAGDYVRFSYSSTIDHTIKSWVTAVQCY